MVSPYSNNSLSIVFFKNKFSGQSTINKFSGDYSLRGNSIIIKNFLHTQEVGIFSKTLQENYIFEVLKNANSLTITDNEIILQTNDQKRLKYYTEPLLFH
jgi:heat shock protein HslJ